MSNLYNYELAKKYGTHCIWSQSYKKFQQKRPAFTVRSAYKWWFHRFKLHWAVIGNSLKTNFCKIVMIAVTCFLIFHINIFTTFFFSSRVSQW